MTCGWSVICLTFPTPIHCHIKLPKKNMESNIKHLLPITLNASFTFRSKYECIFDMLHTIK